ncbi:MAG: hypothetical protein ACPGF7_04520 [Pontibacterium sp.]
MSAELIDIKSYQSRRWGKNGTPLSRETIRQGIMRGQIAGEKIGGKWFVNWAIENTPPEMTAAEKLAEKVLRAM